MLVLVLVDSDNPAMEYQRVKKSPSSYPCSSSSDMMTRGETLLNFLPAQAQQVIFETEIRQLYVSFPCCKILPKQDAEAKAAAEVHIAPSQSAALYYGNRDREFGAMLQRNFSIIPVLILAPQTQLERPTWGLTRRVVPVPCFVSSSICSVLCLPNHLSFDPVPEDFLSLFSSSEC